MDGRRFSRRGFMLDVCRHIMPVADIQKMIDAAAICGMNRMHWHLTAGQGWLALKIGDVDFENDTILAATKVERTGKPEK